MEQCSEMAHRMGLMGVTAEFCERLACVGQADIPSRVWKEGQRTLLNVLATAIGGATTEPVEILIDGTQLDECPRDIPVPGRKERLPLLTAAMITGTAAHYHDFDDTHLETVIHPGAAALASMLPMASRSSCSGEQALLSFIIGCESQLLIGAAITPSHYDAGWHITGTCGALGAAMVGGRLLGFDAAKIEQALGLAASLTVGIRDAFGTMAKPFQVGKAASNGLLAALLVDGGFGGPDGVLERPSGFFDTLASEFDPSRLDGAFDTEWEILANTYKPYPCGIVSHPAIDASIALHDSVKEPTSVESIVIDCHPLVVQLTGKLDPKNGLEARFSTVHGVAVGLAGGRVGLPDYTEDRVADAIVGELRRKASLRVDPELSRDAATVTITMANGDVFSEHVSHARGSRARPMTDEELLSKVAGLVDPLMGGGAAGRLQSAVDGLREAPDVSGLLQAMSLSGLARGDR